ncbi:MAG: enoyl-CoA hydratase [Chloroflexi bacterium]|nr:MAG: enoyl-CoA hydratase [Chloroflexota bacterium]
MSVLDVSLENGVQWLRLNRPESMNAVNAELRAALAAAVRDAERSPEVRVVVVTGSGRAFCSGADVREFASREGAVEAISGEYERILTGLRTMPKPVIAALNGVAAGIGASIAMACDLRYATPEAALVEAFVKIGLTPDGGATWFLPRFIGTAKAFEIMYTGDPLPAADAERFGLYNRVVPADSLEETVRDLAQALARGPAMALAAAKRSVNFSVNSTFEEALDFEFMLQGVQMQGQDFKEGVTAFLEKRKPEFKGE